MPLNIRPPSALTLQSGRAPKQNRYRSTGQELKTVQNDERMAATLHGMKRHGAENEASKRLPPERVASNPSYHQSATPSRHQAQRGQDREFGRKRKATASVSQRPARRQRGNAPELKDEAYIRSTMHMPTPNEYPDAPQDVFKNPRGSIFNLAHGHGLAKCRSETTLLAHDAHQCTAYYISATHNQVVVGEGRTKASRPD